jgi:hypothetical protein
LYNCIFVRARAKEERYAYPINYSNKYGKYDAFMNMKDEEHHMKISEEADSIIMFTTSGAYRISTKDPQLF